MLDALRRLHPVHNNVPAVWEYFEQQFLAKFSDSTRELRSRTALERLHFRFPDIDSFIAEFEDLVVRARYDLGSQECQSLFLKGFGNN
jgi:hypothetical protein